MRAYELSLAVSGTGHYVAWHGGFGKESIIYIQKLDTQGRFVGSPLAVSDGKQLAYEPDLIRTDGQLVVAWYEKDPSTGALLAWLAGVSEMGKHRWAVSLKVGNGSSRNPVVRQVGNALDVAWIEQPISRDEGNRAVIWHRRFSLSGRPLSQAKQIGLANRDTWNLNATVSGRNFVVVYDAALDSKAHELHMLVVEQDHADHQMLSADDGYASLYPDLQVNAAGQAALTWFDEQDGNQEVYLAAAPMARFVKGVIPEPVRVTKSPGNSVGAYLAWNVDTIGLAWIDQVDGRSQMFEQIFTGEARPIGQMHQLAKTEENAGVPAIRAEGKGFLVVWNDYVVQGNGSHMNIRSSVPRTALFASTKLAVSNDNPEP